MLAGSLTLFLLFGLSAVASNSLKRPIIGILSQELSPVLRKHYANYSSYIASSYVKAVESSGARVVPIFINKSRNYYEDTVSSVNGILLPGGNTYLSNHDGYADAGKIIMEIAKKKNVEGVALPVMGICLGMELMMYLEAGSTDIRSSCSAKNVSLALKFLPGYKKSKLFSPATNKIISILKSKNVTYNAHMFCITKENLTSAGLSNNWRPLSTNKDSNGFEFISTIESALYPWVGLQFHPEKNPYAWKRTLAVDHSHPAIRASRYFFDWLVSKAKKNNQSFVNDKLEMDSLIANYPPAFSGAKNLAYDQIYLFQ